LLVECFLEESGNILVPFRMLLNHNVGENPLTRGKTDLACGASASSLLLRFRLAFQISLSPSRRCYGIIMTMLCYKRLPTYTKKQGVGRFTYRHLPAILTLGPE
jgi:hypothetical protein